MESSNDSTNVDYSSLPSTKFLSDVKLYQWNGFWLSPELIQSTQQILTDFKPLPTDVFIASFPKTGQTWLKSLLYCLLNRNSINSLLTIHPQSLIPTIEMTLYGPFAKPLDSFAGITNSSVRIFATHLPYNVISNVVNSSDCRIVYVTRNPKDTLISYWHFIKNSKRFKDLPCSLDYVAKIFCDGNIVFGPYYDHVLEYRKESLEQPKKIFFISYEELKSDCKKHLKRLAEFLGCPFVGDQDEEVLDEIVKICSFEKISNYEANKSSDVLGLAIKAPRNSFFRNGQVGDYKNYLNDDLIKDIDAYTEEKFHGSGFNYGNLAI